MIKGEPHLALPDNTPPYARDLPILKEIFVTQLQHQEFSDKVFQHISQGQKEIMGALEKNRELFVGEIQKQSIEISQLKDENKTVAKALSDNAKFKWKIAKIASGIAFFVFTILGILAYLHLL